MSIPTETKLHTDNNVHIQVRLLGILCKLNVLEFLFPCMPDVYSSELQANMTGELSGS